MKTRIAGVVVAVGVGIVGTVAWQMARADDPGAKSAPGAAQPPGGVQLPNRKKIMDDKLMYTQQILAGLAKNDREKIKTSAEKLVALSQLAEWLNADKGDEYQLQMTLFRRAARMIGRRAEEKNIDGVMLAYSEMTMTCLRCHQIERDFR
jgi:hypothetical protein